MIDLDIVTLLIRLVNAIVWTTIVVEVVESGVPTSTLARKLIASVLFLGFWTLTFGALAPAIVPGPAARTVYTAFTAYSLVVGIALRRTWRGENKLREDSK